MVNSGKKRKKVPVSDPPRRQRMVCLMSEEEVRIVDRYLKKYQITLSYSFQGTRYAQITYGRRFFLHETGSG